MRVVFRKGTKVRVCSRVYPALLGKEGKIVTVHGVGKSGKSAQFKYVQFTAEDTGRDMVVGFFTSELERV